MTEREKLTLKTKPKPQDDSPSVPQGAAQATSKSVKITLVLEPDSLRTVVDSIGKKQVMLKVTAGQTVYHAPLNSKTFRKAVSTLQELGAENCNVLVQGTLKDKNQVEAAGIIVQQKGQKGGEADS